MPIPTKIKNFLDKSKIKYEPIEHRKVFTAYDKAQTLKIPEKIVGKTLVVRFDRNVGLVLIPANKNLDKGKLKKVTKAKSIDFVKEAWMKKNIKGVKLGAIPPFGTLWKIPTFIDRSLINQQKIVINAGNWNWSIRISPTIFKKIIPDLVIGSFTKPR